MKLTFKTDTEILKEINLFQSTLTDEIQKELELEFDNRVMKKYKMTFNEGILVKECHSLGDITHEMVSGITITIV